MEVKYVEAEIIQKAKASASRVASKVLLCILRVFNGSSPCCNRQTT